MHKSITLDRVMVLAESQAFGLENPGICLACGADADGCEPDAEGYTCEECGEPQVSGAAQILFDIVV